MNFASKIIFGSWDFGGSLCYLVFKSNQQFVAPNGEIVQPGVYRRVACTVVGRDRTIPLIADIPATTDAMPSDATWEIYFEDQGHTPRDKWISGAKLPHTYPSPVAWQDIINFNNPPGFIAGPQTGIGFDQAVLLIADMIAAAGGGGTGAIATGIGTLPAEGPVTILSALVSASSPIEIIPRVETIVGNLRVFNRVAGVSFEVISDQGTDFGNFTWNIFA